MKYLFLLLVFLVPVYASAFSISNEQVTGTNPYTISFDVQGSPTQNYIGFSATDILPVTTDQLYLSSCDGILLEDNTPIPYVWHLCYKNFTGDGSYSFSFTVREGYTIGAFGIELSDTVLTVDDWYNSVNWDGVSFIEYTFIGNVTENNIWGNSNGFWGATTPSTIISDMTASVKDTGTNLWPLFTFLGVGFAFAIAGLLVTNIRKQVPEVKTNKRETINPKGNDFIYHSADDLEFKRNYGQQTQKRKRGRPRKII